MKNTIKKFSIPFILLLLISGCASVKVAMYKGGIHYPATDSASIGVFQKKPEGRNFIELGEVNVDGASNWDQIYRIFKIKASEYGGNALSTFINQRRSQDLY